MLVVYKPPELTSNELNNRKCPFYLKKMQNEEGMFAFLQYSLLKPECYEVSTLLLQLVATPMVSSGYMFYDLKGQYELIKYWGVVMSDKILGSCQTTSAYNF